VEALLPQFSAIEWLTVVGEVAVPLNATIDGDPVALLTIVALPLFEPAVVGANCTVTEEL